MSHHEEDSTSSPELVVDTAEYFREMVHVAIHQTKVKTLPIVEQYLINLLSHYLFANNLYDEEESGRRRRETLAEMYLRSLQAPTLLKVELLKKLGDSSLYISGFFGDSLKRQVVDIDYYVDMGGTAYATLAAHTTEDTVSRVYLEMAQNFLDYVDVLTVVSQKALVKTNNDLLRLYDRYVSTGSKLAEAELKEKGMLCEQLNRVKTTKQ